MKNKLIITIIFSVFLLLSPGVKAANFVDGQTVDANKTWTLKFTDNVGFDNLTRQNITVVDSKGNNVPIGVQLGDDDKTILVTAPQGGYTSGEGYILCIGTKVHSNKNQLLKHDYKIHFNIKSDEQSNNSIGNTSSNIINNGIAAIQGDWIYYRNDAEFGNLYKIRSDGTGDAIKLNDDNVSFINVVGNCIYYCNGNFPGGSICKINTDGTNRKELGSGNVSCMQVIGSNLYFAAGGDPGGILATGTIFKMDLNTNKSVSLNLRGDKFIINNNIIYYCSFHSSVYPSSYLYKAQLNGSHSFKTTYEVDENCFAISPDNVIYFSFLPNAINIYDYTNYEYLLKGTFTSSDTKTVVSEMCTSINLNGNFIYYVANQNIYKASLNGEGQTLLSSAADKNPIYTLSSVNVVGDWVYYIENASGKYYKVKTDGTCYQEVD